MPTLCFTGMDRFEETRLKLLFSDANEWLGGNWHLVPETQAQVLVVDLESIYGHMTWLKVHNSGKYVIAISTRTESEAEHLLLRPVTVESLVAALSAASGDPVPAQAAVAPPMKPKEDAGHAQMMPTQQEREPTPPPALAEPAQDVQEQPQPPTAPAPRSPPPATARARDPVLWDYLRIGGLPGPSQLDIADAPSLVIDPRTDTYLGGHALKPYIPYSELGTIRANQWKILSGADLNAHLAAGMTAQPLARLRWMHALLQGAGELSPGYEPTDKFRLIRWPQTEREFPRHFRIATAMMQAPATPAEIAAKGEVALGEVNDFINASLDSGFAELFVEPSGAPDPSAKSGGLLGRLRGRRNG